MDQSSCLIARFGIQFPTDHSGSFLVCVALNCWARASQSAGQHTGQHTGQNTGQDTGQDKGQNTGQHTGQHRPARMCTELFLDLF